MRLVYTKCPICGSKKNYQVLYPSNFGYSDFNKNVFSARRLPDRLHYKIVKCKKDGLVRSNPILPEPSILKLYKKSEFTYSTETKNLSKTYFRALRSVLKNLSKNAKILEVGCGSGFFLDYLMGLGYNNVYGIEPSEDARKKAMPSVKNRIKNTTLTRSIYKTNEFDLICFFQTLDHISNPNLFLSNCYRLLKKGGYIVSFNHDIQSISSKFLGEKSPIIDIEHTYLYDQQTVSKLFQRNKYHKRIVYSPDNIISLRHLLWLMPIPINLKKSLLSTKSKVLNSLLNKSLSLKLGNLCIIAIK